MSVYAAIERRIQLEGPLTSLHLEHEVIDALPEALWEQPLEELFLEEVAFAGPLPNQLFQLASLKELRLTFVAENCQEIDSDQYLQKLPKSIGQLTGLERLDLSGNAFESVPMELEQLINLRELDLSENKLGRANKLPLPKKLQRLDLSNNQLEKVPDEVMELSDLKGLALGANKLTTIPSLPPSVMKLDFSYNPLGHMPAIAHLPLLEEFRLKSCGILRLNPDTHDNLKILDVSYNGLTMISNEVSQLAKLELLNVANNQIQEIQEGIGQLTHLEYFNVSENKLNKFPDQIAELKSLKRINFSTNKFSQFPKRLCALPDLEDINGSWNNLAQILPGIGVLKNLKRLHLFKAGLQFLPEDFSELHCLETCELGYNSLKTLPDFSAMKRLKFLELSGLNKLDFPDEALSRLTNLPSLMELSLQNIPITTLSDSLTSNPNLNRINIGKSDWPKSKKMEIRERFKPIIIWFSQIE